MSIPERDIGVGRQGMLLPDPLDIVAQQPQQESAVKSGIKPTSPLQGMLSDLSAGRYTYGTAGDALRSGRLTQDEFNTFQQAYNQAAGTTPETRTRNVGDLVVTTEMLENARFNDSPFSVDEALAQNIRDARQTTEETQGFQFGIGEDMFQDERQNQGFIETSLGTNVRAGNLGRLTELQDAQTANMLRAQGLEPVYEQTMYKGYRYNHSTGQYDYYDNTPSLIDQAVPALIQAGIMGVATAGLGSALAGGLGVAGSAVGTGVTNAVVNAGLQQAMTGDVDLVQAATAGFNAGLNSYADATKAATEAASVIGATAEMADTARNMQSTLEVLETVKDTINLAEAIDDKNVLGAIDISLGMADLPNTKTFVADKLQETFPDSDIVTRHADSLASATIKTGVKLAEGESVGDAVKSGLLEYVKQGGGLGIGIGESDMLERIDQWVRDLPTTKEDWERWEDNVKNSADAVVRALPTTKEDWQNLEQIIKDGAEVVKTTVVDPVVSVVRETGRAIEEGYDTVEDFVKEDVAPVVRETGRDIREAVDPVANVVRDTGRAIEEVYGEAEDFVKEDVAPVVREVGRDIRDLVPEVDVPSFSTPDISLPSLFGDSTQQGQEEYGNIIGYDDMGLPIYDNTIEILANQLLANQN